MSSERDLSVSRQTEIGNVGEELEKGIRAKFEIKNILHERNLKFC